MIRGLDSSFDRPTPVILAQARAAGVQVWGGYLVSRSDADVLAARNRGEGMFGLAAPWTVAELMDVLDAGLRCIAFCSGWDNPIAVGVKARVNGLLPCLDDEEGIRPVGGWEQAWLDDAQAGHYGGTGAHSTRALFQIVADYPGFDPELTWPSWLPLPAGPVGWQWQGSHQEFGITVDSLWLDDWFAPRGGAQMGAGSIITIDGLTVAAGVAADGHSVRLVGTTGGLGGLVSQPALDRAGPLVAGQPADLREVWVGQDTANGAARLLVGVADSGGSHFYQAFVLDGTWAGSGWYQLSALTGYCRVPTYEGEVLPATMLGNAPAGGALVPHDHLVPLAPVVSGPAVAS